MAVHWSPSVRSAGVSDVGLCRQRPQWLMESGHSQVLAAHACSLTPQSPLPVELACVPAGEGGNRHSLCPVLPGLCWPPSWFPQAGHSSLQKGAACENAPRSAEAAQCMGQRQHHGQGQLTWVGVLVLPLSVWL